MVMIPCFEADVAAFTNGQFQLVIDEFGAYLVNSATQERLQLIRTVDQVDAADGERFRQIATLSTREAQVLEFLGDGVEMHEIAARLGVSVKTVETYRARLKQKLDVKHRMELLAFAVEWKLRRRTRVEFESDGKANRRTQNVDGHDVG